MINQITKNVTSDLISGIVVFLIALPLCLGIALASGAPLFSGILAGIIGGIVVGILSGSSTSVSGPAAGLTAVVALYIQQLGTFEAFLVAVVIAGIIQIGFSIAKFGLIAAFFPSSVIKGLLFAIGVILILKQIPHLFGHDVDIFGSSTFLQMDEKNTFTEIIQAFFDIHLGPTIIGFLSLGLMIYWDDVPFLKYSKIPAPLAIIVIGVLLVMFFQKLGGNYVVGPAHMVQVPIATSLMDSLKFLVFPDPNALKSMAVYIAGFTIALVASLETLLNIEAIDKVDPLQRNSPPNRELFAQGVGNVLSGLIGAIPVTSVIVRSSVNINTGVKTKLSTIFHGFLLLFCVLMIPNWLNMIPLSALAAILLVTGWKLASPKTVMQMWKEGKYQFLPFILTVLAIVFTDLLTGVIIGLAIAIGFILHSNIRRPIRKIMEKHTGGDEVLHIELPNQVSFFNRASLESTFHSVPNGGHILVDATHTDYIDPDILDLITDFKNNGHVKNISVSLTGFKDKYPQLEDRIQYVDYTSREAQESLTPEKVLEVLQEGNRRFRQGDKIMRDLGRQLDATHAAQFPMAVVLSCIDSRSPVELIFDLSLGDIFSVRIAGNVVSRKILGSVEYGCAVAGAKLVLVMGHTSCGAVKAAVDLIKANKTAKEVTGCVNLDFLVREVQKSVETNGLKDFDKLEPAQREEYYNDMSYRNVLRTMRKIREESSTLDNLVRQGKIAIVGAMYDIKTAEVIFFQSTDNNVPKKSYFKNWTDKLLA